MNFKNNRIGAITNVLSNETLDWNIEREGQREKTITTKHKKIFYVSTTEVSSSSNSSKAFPPCFYL